MYGGRVIGTTFLAGTTGATLAKTGFPAFGLSVLALALLLGGLILLRMAAVRRGRHAGETA